MVETILRAPWGMRKMDEIVGPMVSGRVYVIGARSGNGKSTFATSWLNGHMEMVEREFNKKVNSKFHEIPRRVLAFLTERSPEVARLAWAAMRLGYEVDPVSSEAWSDLPTGARDKVMAQLEWINGLEHQGWVKFVDRALPTASLIGDVMAENDPQIVLFDFVQRVRAEGRQSKWDAIADAMHMFQTAATHGGCVVILTSQLKRKGDGMFDKYRPPTDEDFKGAGEIEETADVGLGLFRPLHQMTGKEERMIRNGELDLEPFVRHNEMAVKVVKHRWRGSALDKVFRLSYDRGRIFDGSDPPLDAGDAWEEHESPF